MKHTKESLFNTCIHCKSNKTFLKALEFYKQIGYEPTDNYKDLKFNDLKSGGYLYVIQFGHGLIYFNAPLKRTVIKLPRKKLLSFPRIMMVSDDATSWYTRQVLAKCSYLKYPYITASPPYVPEDEFQIRMRNWKFAKEIKVIYKK